METIEKRARGSQSNNSLGYSSGALNLNFNKSRRDNRVNLTKALSVKNVSFSSNSRGSLLKGDSSKTLNLVRRLESNRRALLAASASSKTNLNNAAKSRLNSSTTKLNSFSSLVSLHSTSFNKNTSNLTATTSTNTNTNNNAKTINCNKLGDFQASRKLSIHLSADEHDETPCAKKSEASPSLLIKASQSSDSTSSSLFSR